MKPVSIVILSALILFPTSSTKGATLNSESINWTEYGRVEAAELSVKMYLTKEGTNVFATLKIQNISQRSLNLFVFHTESRFKVFLEGKEFSYNGPMVSIAPNKSLYKTMAPGETHSVKINLSEKYGLPENAHGTLKVTFNFPVDARLDQTGTMNL